MRRSVALRWTGGAATAITAAAIMLTLPAGPALAADNLSLGAGADGGVALGAFLEVLLIVANVGTAVALFPILKRQSEPLALGYVTRVLQQRFVKRDPARSREHESYILGLLTAHAKVAGKTVT